MKKISITISFVIITVLIYAQQTIAPSGIRFQEELNWQQLLTKTKMEAKYIFVDCYATWCGPCRYMEDSIFSKAETGDFMNKNFLNAKVQMDITPNDNPNVERWYSDAKMIMTKYNIQAFPTYLFLSPDGELVYKAVGSFDDASTFISKVSKSLDPDEQYFFLLEQYNRGEKDQGFLKRLLAAAKQAGDDNMVKHLQRKK